ncbi:MAG: M20/M25/M40 family metallo-hydrolase, partial [Pseudomonadota bacterium]
MQPDDLSTEIALRADDLATLTRDLIRIPTLNPPGDNYLEICEFVAARLAPRGFETQLIRATGTPGDSETHPRWNLVARWTGGPGPCVHFNSHIDVVEVGAGWTLDPFEGVIRDGRVYGRGACDMKGGLASSIVAAEAFIDLNPDHPGSIEISATADEETG